MTARSHYRGHAIEYNPTKELWLYTDTREPVADKPERDCGHCGQRNPGNLTDPSPSILSVDPCLGRLPGVMNACCGHGNPRESYIQFTNGVIVRGFDTIEQAESQDTD